MKPYLIMCLMLITNSVYAGQSYGPYTATVVRVKDGDTVELDIAVWPQQTNRVSLRLAGIDTPEKRGTRNGAPIPTCEKQLAQKATEFTQRLLKPGKAIQVTNIQLGKYAGRVLGDININGESLSKKLIASGHARTYNGGERKGWCGNE